MIAVTLVCYAAFAAWLIYKGYHWNDDKIADGDENNLCPTEESV